MTPTSFAVTPGVRRRLFALWAGYLVFVVYGSLVPFDFRPLPIAQAWALFQEIRMYALGIQSRADWIANGVLYAPLGFLCAQLLFFRASHWRFAHLLAAASFCTALALGVEFAQLYFPPRTVSLNDIVAELAGSLLGIMLATRCQHRCAALLEANVERLGYRLLEAYVAAYLALSLFPYDFLLSSAELTSKMNGNDWGWLLAGRHSSFFQLIAKSGIEIVLTVPLGVLLGARDARRSVGYRTAALSGIVLGTLLEIAQFLTYSGIAQGLSIATRAVGVVTGLALWQHRAAYPVQRVRDGIARHAALLAALYGAVLLAVNGGWSPHWDDIDMVLAKLGELRFQPFYYHYYTTELHALTSALTNALMYLPISVLVWAKHGSARQAALIAACAALLVEGGKLFLTGLRPDPTNLLIAAASAWSCVWIARQLDASGRTPALAVAVASASDSGLVGRHSVRAYRTKTLDLAILSAALTFSGYAVATFPTYRLALAALLVAAAAVVWSHPHWLLAVVVGALPVLDLAPWSGRFFIDEFDLLLLVVTAVGNTRIARRHRATRDTDGDGLLTLLIGLLATSFAVSALRGALPWPASDANTLASYFSPLNALRIAKGCAWSVVILALVRRQVAARREVTTPLAWGMVTGLALSVAFIAWERSVFPGLFDFAADYRVTGPFSAMHTGGAYIECFLAVALPFLLLLIVRSSSWLVRVSGTLLLLGTTYALMVTFSRGGYMAFAVALILFVFFMLFRSRTWKRNALFAVALGVVLLAVAWPVFTGTYAQSRLATIGNDFDVRQRHWREALETRPGDWATTLLGVGLGRFPENTYLFSGATGRTATYQFRNEAGNPYLRLRSGSSLYFEQLVSVVPGQRYMLTLDARSEQPNASLTVPLCEKWLLTAYNCSWNRIKLGNPDNQGSRAASGGWRHFEVTVRTERFRNDRWHARRPIKLALYNGASDTVIDVDNVRLVRVGDASAENQLRNGDFSDGIDHWFFSVDNHLQWHTKSLPVAVLYDQGWFGVLAFGLLALRATILTATRAWRGDLDAAAMFAALSAFLSIGVFDTLIDAPRFLMLLLLIVSCSSLTIPVSSSAHSQKD